MRAPCKAPAEPPQDPITSAPQIRPVTTDTQLVPSQSPRSQAVEERWKEGKGTQYRSKQPSKPTSWPQTTGQEASGHLAPGHRTGPADCLSRTN